MNIRELLSKELTKRIICVVLLLAFALLSMFVISKPATSPETYRNTIKSIDDKKATVMAITAGAAAASAGLAAIPGDVTTPIANQIMEISSYLLIVVCALVLEKSLLTVMGYLSFNILIPIACGLLGVYTFIKKEKLKVLAIKFIALALVAVTIIPFSIKISDMIYEINQISVEQVTNELDESIDDEESKDKSWLEQMFDKIKDTVSAAGEKAKEILNKFIDAIAIFIIAYCVIPIIVVVLMIWFVKFLFGIKAPMPQIDKLRLPGATNNKKQANASEESSV